MRVQMYNYLAKYKNFIVFLIKFVSEWVNL